MLSADDVRQRLADACREVGSQEAWANAHGLSQAYVSNVIRGRKEPGAAILRALKLVRGYGPKVTDEPRPSTDRV